MKPRCRSIQELLCIFLILVGTILVAVSQLYASNRGIQVVSKQGQKFYLYNDYYALVVGVSSYEKWPKLPNAASDAKEVAETLEMMGFQVKLLLDVTSRELKQALNEMVYTLGKHANRAILFYYAGHGDTETLADNTKMGYIIPKDCPIFEKDPLGFATYAISMRDIESISLRIQSKHVIMLFDSCFSGSLFTLVRAVPGVISEKSSLPVRQYITAGREDEQVPDRSMFKRSLLIGLEGDADLTGDGYVTGSELGLYLSEKVINYTHRRQHPQYGKINNPDLDRGDFIFIPLKRYQTSAMKKEESKEKISKAQAQKSVEKNHSERRKESDANLEIVYWNSIKESNNAEMFEEYLKKFPNGSFVELARVNLKKLSKEGYEKRQDFGSYPRIKLAILPMNLDIENSLDKILIRALSNILEENKTFIPYYSHYRLGGKFRTKALSANIISDYDFDNLWIKENIFREKPNWDYICQLGEKLQVDGILVYDVLLQFNEHSNYMKAFLFDVSTKNYHSQYLNMSRWINPGPIEYYFEQLTENILVKYGNAVAEKHPSF
jgi:hypothetical protein